MALSQYENEQASKKLLVKNLNNMIDGLFTKGVSIEPMKEDEKSFTHTFIDKKTGDKIVIKNMKQGGKFLISTHVDAEDNKLGYVDKEISSTDGAYQNMLNVWNKIYEIHNKTYKYDHQKKGFVKLEPKPNVFQKLFGAKKVKQN